MGVLSPQVLSNEKGLEALLIGAYAELDFWAGWESGSPWNSPGSNWLYGDVASDDAHQGSDVGDPGFFLTVERHHNFLPDNPIIYTKWIGVYDGISRSNSVLRVKELAKIKKTITENFGIQIEAEAKFIRAYYHLEAIKMWDFVPFVDESNFDGLIPNQPASGVLPGDASTAWNELERDGNIPWEDVEADFRFAIDNLPETPRNGETGRATKYAALGLLGKTLLYQGKFSEALPLFNEIILSGKYYLPTEYAENFRTSGDNNSESIFQIQASVNDGDPDGNNGNAGEVLNFPYNYGPARCCGFFQPSQDLVNAFKTLNGLPYLEAFGLSYNAEGDEVINDIGILSSEPFAEDTRTLDPRLDWTVGRRGIPYLDWGDHGGENWIREQSWGGPYSPKKMVYSMAEEGINSLDVSGWTSGFNANNYSILRYADVLLMAAECEVESGNLSRARELVNIVRIRAGNPEGYVYENDGFNPAANYQLNPYPSGGPNDPFQTPAGAREAVRFERRLELGLEGHRFWDLKRWGILKETLETYWEKESDIVPYYSGIRFDDFDVRYPIPKSAIDKSNKTLKQNPGYIQP